MQKVTMAFLIILAVLLALGVGIIILQIFLSKKENKWLGLILPFVSFIISLMVLLGVLLFSASTGTMTTTVDGEIVEQATRQITTTSSIIASAVYVFLLFNVPTGVLLAIYAACRGKHNKKRAIEKMSVQDLE